VKKNNYNTYDRHENRNQRPQFFNNNSNRNSNNSNMETNFNNNNNLNQNKPVDEKENVMKSISNFLKYRIIKMNM